MEVCSNNKVKRKRNTNTFTYFSEICKDIINNYMCH